MLNISCYVFRGLSHRWLAWEKIKVQDPSMVSIECLLPLQHYSVDHCKLNCREPCMVCIVMAKPLQSCSDYHRDCWGIFSFTSSGERKEKPLRSKKNVPNSATWSSESFHIVVHVDCEDGQSLKLTLLLGAKNDVSKCNLRITSMLMKAII